MQHCSYLGCPLVLFGWFLKTRYLLGLNYDDLWPKSYYDPDRLFYQKYTGIR